MNMDILISNSSEKPIYDQIATQIKNLIIAGKLKPNEALPSIRLLAKELRISVITTKRAYDELERSGLIETVQGKGSFVAPFNQEFLQEEQQRIIETSLLKAIEIAKQSNISLKELDEILRVLYEED